jgi:hypothetical protein
MQSGQFSNGGKYAHKVFLSGYKRKFSVWYSADREFQSAEAIDARGRSYPVTKAQRAALCRLFNLTIYGE